MSPATPEENKQTARRLVREVYENGDLSLVDEMLTEDALEHEGLADMPPVSAREMLKDSIMRFRTAFPDLTVTVEDDSAEGDMVFQRSRWEGTHQGPFLGIEPTGKRVSFESMDEIRFRDGKIVEHWGVSDSLTLLMQLGVVDMETLGLSAS